VLKDEFLKLDNKVVKCIVINYVVGVKAYKLYDHVDENFKYKNIVLRKLKSSVEEGEKKLVVYLVL